MRTFALAGLLLLATACGAAATTFDLNLNDYSAQIQLAAPLTSDAYGTSVATGRFLHNEDEDTTLGSVGIDFLGSPGNIPGFEFGVGAQLAGGEGKRDQEILAAGVGARVNFQPPGLQGVGLAARAYYFPSIFSMLDVDRMYELALRGGYALTPKVSIYAEYQNMRADFEDTSGRTGIDEGVRVGFEAKF